jgi:hypothetical protein
MRLPTRVIAQRQQWSCMRRRSCSLCSLRETTTSPFLCWQPPRHKITQATFRLLYVYSPPFSASTQSVSGVSSLICGRKKGTARFATELALRISKGKQWMKKCEVGFYFFLFLHCLLRRGLNTNKLPRKSIRLGRCASFFGLCQYTGAVGKQGCSTVSKSTVLYCTVTFFSTVQYSKVKQNSKDFFDLTCQIFM